MFITKDLCYLEMYKTGSQHIVKLLEKSVPEGKRIGNHNRPNDEVYKSNIYFLGSIRNPWDWYVSLWNFGCEKRGSLYNRLTSKKIYLDNFGFRTKPLLSPYIFIQQLWKPLNKWRYLYSDSSNINNFRSWIKLLLGNARAYDSGDGYGLSSISKFSGIMTYRYLTLYTKNIKKLFDDSILSYESLKNFDQENNVLNYVIKNESLEKNFIEFLLNNKIQINENMKDQILKLNKTNTSTRNIKLSNYFDIETL